MTLLNPRQLDQLATSLRAGEYNLLIGAGISLGSLGGDHKNLPTGDGLRRELCSQKGAKDGTSLQRVYELLDEHEVKHLITDRFSKTQPGPAISRVPSFPWRRIFTLNIDDAVEQAYEDGPSLQTLVVRNYKDLYEESRELSSVPIVHLHGYSRRPADGYIFSRSAYVSQLTRVNSWMAVLADLMAVEPFIIIGTSLDEVDLDFYLAQRSQTSARFDKGPGVFVEPYPDAVTLKDCEKHDLIHFEGTAEDFFTYLDKTVSDRRAPVDLIAIEASNLFPSTIDRIAVAKFLADFEIVPGHTSENVGDPRFLLGHEPTWNDLQSQLDIPRISSNDLSRAISTALERAIIYLT